jgi:hypothetical protein
VYINLAATKVQYTKGFACLVGCYSLKHIVVNTEKQRRRPFWGSGASKWPQKPQKTDLSPSSYGLKVGSPHTKEPQKTEKLTFWAVLSRLWQLKVPTLQGSWTGTKPKPTMATTHLGTLVLVVRKKNCHFTLPHGHWGTSAYHALYSQKQPKTTLLVTCSTSPAAM